MTTAMSASRAPIAVMRAPNAAIATVPWMSFVARVWVNYCPIPRQPKIDSVRIAPVKTAGIENATWVVTGMSEVRSACRRIACCLVSPLARAIRT